MHQKVSSVASVTLDKYFLQHIIEVTTNKEVPFAINSWIKIYFPEEIGKLAARSSAL